MLWISPDADWLLALKDWQENSRPEGLADLLRQGDGPVPEVVRDALRVAIGRALEPVGLASIRTAAIAATAAALLPPDPIPVSARVALAELVQSMRRRGAPSSVTECERWEIWAAYWHGEALGKVKAFEARLMERFPGIPLETIRSIGKGRGDVRRFMRSDE